MRNARSKNGVTWQGHLRLIVQGKIKPKLKIIPSVEKGRCVVADQKFNRLDIVCQYKGELITGQEGRDREETYPEDSGSFLFFFTLDGKEYCLDATPETNHLDFGRLINHSIKDQNLKPRASLLDGNPVLYFTASKDIEAGEEILYDYHDRRKLQVGSFPFLAK